VVQAGGRVEVASVLGRGTTFTVYLPRAEENLTPADLARPTAAPHGTETILLAEDEPAVRSFVRSVLEASGYTILEVENGHEGLKTAEAFTAPIHLLITDVVMPRMGGRELAGKLCDKRAGLKVLFMSGYADDDALRRAPLQSGQAFLQKPFTPSLLAWKVRQLLDG